tara:strand:+ start:2218 stop:2442 length:225 start_codon:yes stop_codon:yes gene_type:complete
MSDAPDLLAEIETLGDLSRHISRCEAARNAGGVPRNMVAARIKQKPRGWALDERTGYYIPPKIILFPGYKEKRK